LGLTNAFRGGRIWKQGEQNDVDVAIFKVTKRPSDAFIYWAGD